MGGYYRLKPSTPPDLYALFTLACDIEITTFDGEGRDATFKGSAGDVLVLISEEGDDWEPLTCLSQAAAENSYEPIGEA